MKIAPGTQPPPDPGPPPPPEEEEEDDEELLDDELPVDELDVELLLDGDGDELLGCEVLEDEPVVVELLDKPM